MTLLPELPETAFDDEEAVSPLLTKRDVAVYLGLSERTVDRLVVAGALAAYRVGGHRRFRSAEVHLRRGNPSGARAPASGSPATSTGTAGSARPAASSASATPRRRSSRRPRPSP
jgi:excisionase family DNA binding protein